MPDIKKAVGQFISGITTLSNNTTNTSQDPQENAFVELALMGDATYMTGLTLPPSLFRYMEVRYEASQKLEKKEEEIRELQKERRASLRNIINNNPAKPEVAQSLKQPQNQQSQTSKPASEGTNKAVTNQPPQIQEPKLDGSTRSSNTATTAKQVQAEATVSEVSDNPNVEGPVIGAGANKKTKTHTENIEGEPPDSHITKSEMMKTNRQPSTKSEGSVVEPLAESEGQSKMTATNNLVEEGTTSPSNNLVNNSDNWQPKNGAASSNENAFQDDPDIAAMFAIVEAGSK
jgi:hypothetical protein